MPEKKPLTPQEAAAIALARDVLEALRADNPDLAARIAKILPGYARRMAQQGGDVTIAHLLAAAEKGAKFLKSIFNTQAAQESFLDRYRKITESLIPESSFAYDEPPLALAVRSGDIDEICRILDEDPFVDELRGMALNHAAQQGRKDIVGLLLDRGADIYFENSYAIGTAAQAGQIDTLDFMLQRVQYDQNIMDRMLARAVSWGQAKSVRYLLEKDAKFGQDDYTCLIQATMIGAREIFDLLFASGQELPQENKNKCLRRAAIHNRTEIAALLLDRGANAEFVDEDGATPLQLAAQNGHCEIVKLLIDRGVDVRARQDKAINLATFAGHADVVRLLFEHRGKRKPADGVLANALFAGDYEIADLAMSYGGKAKLVTNRRDLDAWQQARDRWQAVVRVDPPRGLAHYDPAPFKPAVFKAVADVLLHEGCSRTSAHMYAYNAVALFQSEDRVLRFMQTWGQYGKTPLHDLLQNIQLPEKLDGADLSAWGDAVLKHGPLMAKLVKFCDRLPQPLMSADGKTWSYARTREAVAQYAYARASEHVELAALCFAHAVDEDDFNRALDIASRAPSAKNLPDITIDGAEFGMRDVTFRRLASTDVRGLFLGEITDCCQSIGNHGSDCAEHGFTSENGGFYVIETKAGEIIGQSWAWRGKEGELCLDSLEALGGRIGDKQWQAVLDAMGRQLKAQQDHDVTALHVGTGGRTPSALAKAFEHRDATPRDYRGYRDSDRQLRIWAAPKR